MVLVCMKCGAQYRTDEAPTTCILCVDERGSLGRDGQKWAEKSELLRQHKNTVHEEEPGLLSIGTEPLFGIGQRALLIQTGAITPETRAHCMGSRCTLRHDDAAMD